MKHKTFTRGIHPSYNKGFTAEKATMKARLPERVIIPLNQHIGAPCAALVKRGDQVAEGQKVGDVESFISAPVHASISGTVKEIAPHPHPSGTRVLSVVIESDGAEKVWEPVLEDSEIFKLSPDEIRSQVREAGIVGLGGASFPTYVKFMPSKGSKVDVVILNGCECEPFLTADHRIMTESPDKVLKGLKVIMQAVGAPKGIVGVEDNKPGAIAALKSAAATIAPDVEIVLLETKYPQGAEKMLIKAVLNKKVPVGKLPLDVGVVVNNVGTAAAVYDALHLGKPVIERIVTVSGSGVNSPGNFMVRVGTPFFELIGQAGGLATLPAGEEREVLNGGPMMGIAQRNLLAPVIKGTSGITVLAGKRVKPREHSACIRCSACVEVCPMGLMPYRIADMGRLEMVDDFKRWSGLACIECGCCSFVCPSRRPLVQWIRVGKIKVRETSRG
ncbi:Electron transport complex protein RnfC [hydrothermal vent metagenome]|uniref:Electron transport complex protein RnfC n=1 Tax=hydrothermal vent metagenome TaxID=652676 RepID=A0A3B0VG60_9ZZZZ